MEPEEVHLARFEPQGPLYDRHVVNRRLKWFLPVLALPLVLGAIFYFGVLGGESTDSDESFDFSEACGGDVTGSVLQFERFMQTTDASALDKSIEVMVRINVRDDDGKLAETQLDVLVDPAHWADPQPLLVSAPIQLDREPVGQVMCVARSWILWETFGRAEGRVGN